MKRLSLLLLCGLFANTHIALAEDPPPPPPQIPIPIEREMPKGSRGCTQHMAMAYVNEEMIEIQFYEQIGIVTITITDDLGYIDSITADSATDSPQLYLTRKVEGMLTITVADADGVLYIGLCDL